MLLSVTQHADIYDTCLRLKADWLDIMWLCSTWNDCCKRTIAIVCTDNFEKLYSTLNRLMVEGDLLEVSLPEKLQLRHVLRICHPADYEQIVFGFPVNTAVLCMHRYVMLFRIC